MEKKTGTTCSNLPYAFTYQEIFNAYKECIKTKRNSTNAIDYSMNKTEKLIALCDEINSLTYKIGKSIAFVVKFPVLREVFAADFRDRIIHHLVMIELMPYFEKEFAEQSFSCRKGKGVIYGVNYIYNEIQECTQNYTRDAWILKMDIKSFFMSIDKQLLADIIDNFIIKHYPENRKKETLRALCQMIILHHPENNCERRGDLELWDYLPFGKSLFDVGFKKGLPIGNLTSQIFANFYLNSLDKYITETLGFKYYGRYVDDFVIICEDKKKLKRAMPLICAFAKDNLKITVHPHKRYLQHYTKGVRFIGGVLKKNRKYILNRTKGNFYYKLKKKYKKYDKDKAEEFMMCVNSYLGFLIQYKSYNIRKEILTSDLLKEWKPYIIIDKDYKKITLLDNTQKIKFSTAIDVTPETEKIFEKHE